MCKDIKILYIPDVHGRDFWKEPVKKTLEENTDAKIIFLGDYVDAYPHEWDKNFDYQQHTFDNFKEIVELKKEFKEKITLLLGNHCATYAIGKHICECRTDYKHFDEIKNIFNENRTLFQLAEETKINDKHYIFSHAGITKGWIDYNFKNEEISSNNVVEFLNNMWYTQDYDKLNKLGQYDKYRGYFGYEYGSPLWADLNSTYKLKKEDTYGDLQIVGHTQLQNIPLIFANISCFDCRKCFYLNSIGDILYYDNDENCKKTNPTG